MALWDNPKTINVREWQPLCASNGAWHTPFLFGSSDASAKGHVVGAPLDVEASPVAAVLPATGAGKTDWSQAICSCENGGGSVDIVAICRPGCSTPSTWSKLVTHTSATEVSVPVPCQPCAYDCHAQCSYKRLCLDRRPRAPPP